MDTGNPLAARLAVLLLAYLPEDLTSAPPSIPCPAETWPMRIACDHNVTQVVIGQTARGHLDSLLRGSVINQILREARNVDVHVVADRSTRRD